MPTSTVENYLKQIYLEQQSGEEDLVPMGKLASVMGVVPGTATSMVKALSDSGLVDYEPRGGARLTAGGEQLALHVLRRHRLVELFLVRVLKLDWSEVHAEAEELEHVISDKVLDRIDALLGHPKFDPHGDPIPPAKGKLAESRLQSLAECKSNRRFRVARVTAQDPQFLKFLNRCGLLPGVNVVVENRDLQADSVIVRIGGDESIPLGTAAATKILVENA
jgi:DtxR family transcriptional regulator, Mn-dependent transcriptional regulator